MLTVFAKFIQMQTESLQISGFVYLLKYVVYGIPFGPVWLTAPKGLILRPN